jgi:hypothetical protein
MLVALILALAAFPAGAWGPHPAITQAALDVIGTNHSLVRFLGGHAQRLTNYCWLADFKRLPFRDVDQDFYADDYLLFPPVTTHIDHICPEVKRSFTPYFRRALQAMRTESRANAARWIGSLLHFTEGSISGNGLGAYNIDGVDITVEEQEIKARRKMHNAVMRALPPKRAARYLQLEANIRAVRAYDIAVAFPLVQ